jgi:hypothetical protein
MQEMGTKTLGNSFPNCDKENCADIFKGPLGVESSGNMWGPTPKYTTLSITIQGKRAGRDSRGKEAMEMHVGLEENHRNQ